MRKHSQPKNSAVESEPFPEPVIRSRSQHPVSRKNIDADAVKILYRLHNHGFTAYLAGGAVRDLLLGKRPADFDIVTDAGPKQIRKIFRNSRIIGRRFRLVHIFFHKGTGNSPQIYEVATFRRPFTSEQDNYDELIEDPALANNLFGTPAEDARRRDFTVNALFYNIADFTVIDHVDGLQDLNQGIIRIIGNPETRFAEDPVRVLRALEFACRLGFNIEPDTVRGLQAEAWRLAEVSPSRLREELKGLYRKKNTAALLAAGRQYDINHHWLPAAVAARVAEAEPLLQCIEDFFPLENQDNLLEKMVICALLLPVLRAVHPLNEDARLHLIADETEKALLPLSHRFNLPRFQRHDIKEIFQLLYRLGRGDKRLRRLSRRENFLPALFLFAACNRSSESENPALSFWRSHLPELIKLPETQGLDYEGLLGGRDIKTPTADVVKQTSPRRNPARRGRRRRKPRPTGAGLREHSDES